MIFGRRLTTRLASLASDRRRGSHLALNLFGFAAIQSRSIAPPTDPPKSFQECIAARPCRPCQHRRGDPADRKRDSRSRAFCSRRSSSSRPQPSGRLSLNSPCKPSNGWYGAAFSPGDTGMFSGDKAAVHRETRGRTRNSAAFLPAPGQRADINRCPGRSRRTSSRSTRDAERTSGLSFPASPQPRGLRRCHRSISVLPKERTIELFLSVQREARRTMNSSTPCRFARRV